MSNGFDARLQQVIGRIRPSVRAERPYVVGGIDEVRVKLNQNENPYDLPPELKRELIEEFFQIPFNRYPTEQPERLRRALGEVYGHDPEGILPGNGSNELTYVLGLTLIEPGSPVVLPRPMFSLYEKVAMLFDSALVSVPCRPDLSFDAGGLLEAVRRHRPVLTVLTSPNNPTGLAMKRAEIEAIVDAAEGVVVVDEAYLEFNEEGSMQSLLSRAPNLVLMRTFSKAFGLAGLRLGYMMGHPDVIREFGKGRVPFMVDPLTEATALALLRRRDWILDRAAMLKEGLRLLAKEMEGVEGVEVLPSAANFVIFKTRVEPRTLMTRLAQAGVLVRNMGGYPELSGYLRVNAGTPDENKQFVVALKQALHQTAPV
jgi:histidinol-phosphate aminotransferase